MRRGMQFSVGAIVGTLVTVVIALAVINRVDFLKKITTPSA